MKFTDMRNNYSYACTTAFNALRKDNAFWEAADDWNLEEIGKRTLVHLLGSKTELEVGIQDEENFDADEAADDVIRESRHADISDFNRKLS